MKKQVELSITHNGKDVVAYPYSKKCKIKLIKFIQQL